MERFRNYRMLLLVALVMVASISVAYAALSSTLTVTMNKVTQSVVNFGPTITSCSKVSDVGTSSTGRTCGDISVGSGNKSVTVADTTLSKPEDGCIYKCTITNPTNYIGAKLGSVVPTEPSSTTCTKANATTSASAYMTCGNITYGIYASASASGTTISTTNFTINNNTMATNSTKDFYLVLRYSGSALNSTAVTQSGGKFTFTWNQN